MLTEPAPTDGVAEQRAHDIAVVSRLAVPFEVALVHCTNVRSGILPRLTTQLCVRRGPVSVRLTRSAP